MGSQSPLALRALSWGAIAYLVLASAYVAVYAWRFHGNPISSDPGDWTSFAEMLGALLGPPLALWSVGLVLKSIWLQQVQVDKQQRHQEDALERENRRLDPKITRIERDALQDSFPQFVIDYEGDAHFQVSTAASGPKQLVEHAPHPYRQAFARFWQISDIYPDYRAFISYQRANGSEGWYRVFVTERKFLVLLPIAGSDHGRPGKLAGV